MVKISFGTHERNVCHGFFPKIKWIFRYIRHSLYSLNDSQFEGTIFMKIHFHSFIILSLTINWLIQYMYIVYSRETESEWVYRVSDFIEFNELCLLWQCSAIFRISRFFRIHATPHILFKINFRMATHSERKRSQGFERGRFTIHKCENQIESIASCTMQFLAIEKLIMKCVFRTQFCRQKGKVAHKIYIKCPNSFMLLTIRCNDNAWS